MHPNYLALALAGLAVFPTAAFAQSSVPATAISDTIIVTGSRNPEDPPVVAAARARLSETPGSVAVVSQESYAGRQATGLTDMLRDVPGVFIQKKWGNDTRLSIRGSGIGNANHLRGTLIAHDGIPLNDADGYGDTQFIDPFTARYTEVYKGGNALRFGGALLGGAINIVTPTGKTIGHNGAARLDGGAGETLRGHIEAGGERGAWDAFAAISGYQTGGWRDQSKGQWQFASANIGRTFDEDREVRFYLSGGYIHQEIPGSLTLSDALTRPEIANPTNVMLNYQRDQRVWRSALQSRWRLDESSMFEGGLYVTWKDLDHPIFQVLDQESRNWGAFGRIDWNGEVFGKNADLFYGLSYRSGDLDANQWINIRGSKGARTAKSRQNATGLDVFAEGRLFVSESFALVGGGSYGRAEREYQSHAPSAVVVADNETNDWLAPRLGFIWQNEQGAQVYGNVTRSLEPPNFSALAPTTGGFQPLKAQDAVTAEIGTRGRAENVVWDVAYYRAEIDNELLSYSVNAALGIPAATFNALDGTMHQGIEAGLDWQITEGLRLRQTYMWSDFRFSGDRQYGDNSLPIVPEHFYRAELKWTTQTGFWIAPSIEWSISDVWVDFANTFKAPGYDVLNLSVGRDFDRVSVFLDLRNLTDERYISNVTALTNYQTTAAASRTVFFPGDERSVFGGLLLKF
jgi:iron complex outermembrane receptor protein